MQRRLERWRAAGLIDAGQVERILAFEAAGSVEAEAGGGRADAERPSILEALLYLGVAVAVVGVFTLIAQNWEELRPWARVAVLAVPGALLLAAGQAMRASGQPAIERAGGMAWLASVAVLTGAVAVFGTEADWPEDPFVLAVGGFATALALVLWVLHPRHPQVFALAGGLVLLATGVTSLQEQYEMETFGLLLTLFGAVGVALAERRLFGPRESAVVLGAAGVMAGLNIAAYATESNLVLELLVFVAGALLIAVGLRSATFPYIVIAVGGIFVGLVAFIFRHFEDQLGAPLALLLTGTLVIAAVLILVRVRSGLRPRTAP